MKIAYYKMKDYKLGEYAFDEIMAMAVTSMRCGIELEGQHLPPRMEDRCGFDRRFCGICNRGRCPTCQTCVNRVGQGFSRPPALGAPCWGYASQRCRLHQQVIAQPDTTISINSVHCRPCLQNYDCCSICMRCSLCSVCSESVCQNPIRGEIVPQRNDRRQVIERVASSARCSVGKQYDVPLNMIKGDFLWAYVDGSVDTELVTKPFPIYTLSRPLKKGIAIFEKHNVVMSPSVRAGCHQTFSFDKTFPDIVARNIVQLTRYYLPALLAISCIDGTQGRSSDFRRLPPWPGWSEKARNFNEKYNACHVKPNLALNYQPKLIEFRYPDMHPRLNQHMASVVINFALILTAIQLSRMGVAVFSNVHWETVEGAVSAILRDGMYDDTVKELKAEMLNYFSEAISRILTNYYVFLDELGKWSIPPTEDEVNSMSTLKWTGYVKNTKQSTRATSRAQFTSSFDTGTRTTYR